MGNREDVHISIESEGWKKFKAFCESVDTTPSAVINGFVNAIVDEGQAKEWGKIYYQICRHVMLLKGKP